MNEDPSQSNDSLPVEALERIDRVCETFEKAWQAGGEPPKIEGRLGEVSEEERGTLLRELLRLDLDYRRRRAEHPHPAQYLARFPGYEPAVAEAFRREEAAAAAAEAARRPSEPRPTQAS